MTDRTRTLALGGSALALTPPPGGGAEVDLVAVRLEGDGEFLAITWEVAGEVPVTTDFLLWSFPS